MRIRRRARVSAGIPTASMADIAFLLLIFFTCTTVFRIENGRQVELPFAEQGEEARPGTTRVRLSAGPDGDLSLDDRPVQLAELSDLLGARLRDNPDLCVDLAFDRGLPYAEADRALSVLKQLRLRHVSFAVREDAPASP